MGITITHTVTIIITIYCLISTFIIICMDTIIILVNEMPKKVPIDGNGVMHCRKSKDASHSANQTVLMHLGPMLSTALSTQPLGTCLHSDAAQMCTILKFNLNHAMLLPLILLS